MSTFATVNVCVLVYVKSCVPSIAAPPLPMVYVVVVQPIGIQSSLLSRLICDHTVVVEMILIRQQDSLLLEDVEQIEFVDHS